MPAVLGLQKTTGVSLVVQSPSPADAPARLKVPLMTDWHAHAHRVFLAETSKGGAPDLTPEYATKLKELEHEELEIFGDQLCVDGVGGLCSELESEHAIESPKNLRERIHLLLDSPASHILIMTLVLIDAICITVELSLSIAEAEHRAIKQRAQWVGEAAEWIGSVILYVFLLETVLHLWTSGFKLFHSKMQACDFMVVWGSYCLRLYVEHQHDEQQHGGELVQLLLLVRLWRVIRVVDAVALAATLRTRAKFRQRLRELDSVVHTWQERYLHEREKKIIAMRIGSGQLCARCHQSFEPSSSTEKALENNEQV